LPIKRLLRPSWSWSYGSWIYNYPCNQCVSPQTLWVRIPIRRGVLDTTLCDKVCQSLVADQWFSLCTPVSFTNKTDSYDISEILLKVALIIITITPLYVPLLLPDTDHVSKLKIMSEVAHDYWKWLIYWLYIIFDRNRLPQTIVKAWSVGIFKAAFFSYQLLIYETCQ
jgi:hypothetical protein